MVVGDTANSGIRTPEGLSAAEREELIERARYEAFREEGANARAVRQSVLAFLVIGAIAAGVSLWIAPMLADSLLARALYAGTVAGCWGGLATYWISRDRAKIINAKIQELGEREALTGSSTSAEADQRPSN